MGARLRSGEPNAGPDHAWPQVGLGASNHQKSRAEAVPLHRAGHERGVAHRILGPVDRRQHTEGLFGPRQPGSPSRQGRDPMCRRRHSEQVELFHLPPYIPERNPTEVLNRNFKTHLRLDNRSANPKALRKKQTLLSVMPSQNIRASWPTSPIPSSSTPLDRTYLVAGSLTYNELNIVGDQTALTEGSTSLELSKTAS